MRKIINLQQYSILRAKPYMGFVLSFINVFVHLGAMGSIIWGGMMAAPATQAWSQVPLASNGPVRIVAFGDSLTAGYMLPPEGAFPAQLAAKLKTRGYNIEMINAGVSGDTTANGLERFDWSVPDGTDAVILELGANDALRGIEPVTARKNLDAILSKLKARNIEVLLAGMSAPQNWGANYADEFNAIYKDLSQTYATLLYPFFLEGVALKPDLNLSDGLHPTVKGIGVIVERITPAAEALIARVLARRVQPAN